MVRLPGCFHKRRFGLNVGGKKPVQLEVFVLPPLLDDMVVHDGH